MSLRLSCPTLTCEAGVRSCLSQVDLDPAKAEVTITDKGVSVKFQDQQMLQVARDKLEGFTYEGSTIKAQITSDSAKSISAAPVKLCLPDVPTSVSLSEVEKAFSEFRIEPTEEETTETDNKTVKQGDKQVEVRSINLWFSSRDSAEKAAKSVDNINGVQINPKMNANEQKRSPKRVVRGSNLTSSSSVDFPLRILVQSDMVGAIIGKGGQTIRQITQQTRARVDVHRKDNLGATEKAITIYGQPENCTNACNQILRVMEEEKSKSSSEKEDDQQPEEEQNNKAVQLKILAHNNLIGRIIGKQGATIKKIMEDTDTKITVSSINEMTSVNQERIITIMSTSSSVDAVSAAESQVSARLRAAYENDVHAMAPQSILFPGLHPAAMMSTVSLPSNGGVASGGAGPSNGFQQNAAAVAAAVAAINGGRPQGQQQTGFAQGNNSHLNAQETVFVYVPNNAVGALIGTKGSHIRNMIKFSGASVKIAPPAEGTESVNSDRKVTILGSPESQWKAQYLIFEKLREEAFAKVAGVMPPEVTLTVEISVPSSHVGKIIGKGGANVRELQRVTGAVVRLPEQGAEDKGEETPVQMAGNFFSVQSAQRRLRSTIQSSPRPQMVNGRANSITGATSDTTEC